MDQDEHVQNIYKRNFLGMVSEETARFLCSVVVLFCVFTEFTCENTIQRKASS
jgi:hypothetical protein